MGSRLRIGALALVLAAIAVGSALAGGTAQTRQAIVAPPVYSLQPWTASTDNLVPAQGTVVLNGAPISGAYVSVDSYAIPKPTDAQGHFTYLLDHTLLGRHVVTVTDASNAKAGGQPLTDAERTQLLASHAAITVAYTLKGLKVARDSAGRPVVTGRLVDARGTPPPPVGLFTYQLTGTVTDSKGNPVVGAQVSTRTQDRDYWTVSTVTDAKGFYTSLFTASAESPGNPVPFTVRVSKGDDVYQFLPEEVVNFQRLQSARLDIRLPPSGYAMAIPRPVSYPGAVYTGVVPGVTFGNQVVRPVSATWLDSSGGFKMVLPARLAGKTVSLWEARLNLFSRAEATPGVPIDLAGWPTALPSDAPRQLLQIKLG